MVRRGVRARVLALALAMATGAVVAAEPQDPQVLFEAGLESREAGELEAAIKAFQTILQINPQLHRARLELAVAYFQARNFDAARKHAEQVLNDPGTPENVRVRIRQFLARIESSRPRSRWQAHAGAGLLFDSNVNAGPDNDVVGDLGLTPGSAETGDHALRLRLGASHRYVSGRRMGADDAMLLWLSQVDYYRTDYRDENDFDLDVLSVSTGPAWFAARQWRAGVDAQVDGVRLGGDSFATFAGLSPYYTWVRNDERTEVTLDARLQKRDYRRSVDAGRDSTYADMGLSVGHLLDNQKLSLQAGIRVLSEDADTARYTNDGYQLFVGGNWRESRYSNIYGRLERRDVEYDGVEPAFGAARDETQYRFVLGGNHQFRSGFLKDWVVKGNVTLTHNTSNLAAFEYDREQVALTIERIFD